MQNYEYELVKQRLQERHEAARLRALARAGRRPRSIYSDWIMKRRRA